MFLGPLRGRHLALLEGTFKPGVDDVREQAQGSLCDRREQSFVNKDQSLNVVLEALPIEGRLHIREPRAHEDKGARARGEFSLSQAF